MRLLFLLGFAGEIDEDQPEGSRGRLGVDQQGEAAKDERAGCGGPSQIAPGTWPKTVETL